ncbi:hypothetical protein RFI_32086 [Reticulomyxa filosa]|uniref:Uncharacterized protein n=1 Tax=Reticulomyxa filosa TaxID=46433 RepID=X6LX50_RETFI|nr:hypothetical protein RFI_32086 [Reticulomyxa filosa]|eukprot:ETO05310.1 hypothetical protein RFI_32086 [Reticulomyxa filosa]
MDVTFDTPEANVEKGGSFRSALEFASCVGAKNYSQGGVLPHERFFSKQNMDDIKFVLEKFQTAVDAIQSGNNESKENNKLNKNEHLTSNGDETTFTSKLNDDTNKDRRKKNITSELPSQDRSRRRPKKRTGSSKSFVKSWEKIFSILEQVFKRGDDVGKNGLRNDWSPDPKTPPLLLLCSNFDNDRITISTLEGKEVLFPMHNQAAEVAQDIQLCIHILDNKILPDLKKAMSNQTDNVKLLTEAKEMLVDTIKEWAAQIAVVIQSSNQENALNNANTLNAQLDIVKQILTDLNRDTKSGTKSVFGGVGSKILKPLDEYTVLVEHHDQTGVLNQAVNAALGGKAANNIKIATWSEIIDILRK